MEPPLVLQVVDSIQHVPNSYIASQMKMLHIVNEIELAGRTAAKQHCRPRVGQLQPLLKEGIGAREGNIMGQTKIQEKIFPVLLPF